MNKRTLASWQFLHDAIAARPTKIRNLDPAEFAETTVVTAGPKRGTRFSLDNAPYIRKPLRLIGPLSPIQFIYLMFPTQTAKSVFCQLATTYYAKEIPSEGIYVAPDEKRGRMTMERRIEPLFKSVGIEFRTSAENRKSRRTGDLTLSKEFDGGNLDMATANSAASMSQETKRFGIGDELDRWKISLGTEGTPWSIFVERMEAWKQRKKIIGVSTPTDWDISLIFQRFLEGTQEEYFVPCYRCGHMQILQIKRRSGYGLNWKLKNDRVVESSIVYVCEKCAESFKEIRKYQILLDGEWREQAEPMTQYIASFHISALNSNFKSWYEIATKYTAQEDNPRGKKDFENLVMGMPHKDIGIRPNWKNIVKLKGKYKSGTVPMGVLLLTMGVDVQRGSKKYEKMTDAELETAIAGAGTDSEEKDFPRLELEVLGTGPGYRTWSILYKRFLGRTDNPKDGAFALLTEWAKEIARENGDFGFLRSDGVLFPIKMTFVDSGDGESTGVVYQFTREWTWCFPCKGNNTLQQLKGEKGDPLTNDSFMRYKKRRVDQDIDLYNISTNPYKDVIYAALKRERVPGDIQKTGFCDFPMDRNNDYFKMLTAEERREDHSYHAGGRRNESLDCRVYSQCAAEVYLDILVEVKRQEAKKKKASDLWCKTNITQKAVIDQLCIEYGLPESYYKKG